MKMYAFFSENFDGSVSQVWKDHDFPQEETDELFGETLIGAFNATKTLLPLTKRDGNPTRLPKIGEVGCSENGDTFMVIL